MAIATDALRRRLENLSSVSNGHRTPESQAFSTEPYVEELASATGPHPQLLHVTTPHGWPECAGYYGLFEGERPNGQPAWKRVDGDTWLYSSPHGQWMVGGPSERKQSFNCSTAWIYCSTVHGGAAPDKVAGVWERWTGNSFLPDTDIVVAAVSAEPPLSPTGRTTPASEPPPQASTRPGGITVRGLKAKAKAKAVPLQQGSASLRSASNGLITAGPEPQPPAASQRSRSAAATVAGGRASNAGRRPVAAPAAALLSGGGAAAAAGRSRSKTRTPALNCAVTSEAAAGGHAAVAAEVRDLSPTRGSSVAASADGRQGSPSPPNSAREMQTAAEARDPLVPEMVRRRRRAITLAERWAAGHAAQPSSMQSITYPSGTTVVFADLATRELRATALSQEQRAVLTHALESGSFARTALQKYKALDVELEGSLAWNNGSVRDFVKSAMTAFGLGPPAESSLVTGYGIFDSHRRGPLDTLDCLCLADALLRTALLYGAIRDSAQGEAPAPGDVARWTPQDVAHWATSVLGLPAEVGALMIAEEIQGSVLLTLSEGDLQQLGVAPFGRRRQLLIGIAGFAAAAATRRPTFDDGSPLRPPSPRRLELLAPAAGSAPAVVTAIPARPSALRRGMSPGSSVATSTQGASPMGPHSLSLEQFNTSQSASLEATAWEGGGRSQIAEAVSRLSMQPRLSLSTIVLHAPSSPSLAASGHSTPAFPLVPVSTAWVGARRSDGQQSPPMPSLVPLVRPPSGTLVPCASAAATSAVTGITRAASSAPLVSAPGARQRSPSPLFLLRNGNMTPVYVVPTGQPPPIALVQSPRGPVVQAQPQAAVPIGSAAAAVSWASVPPTLRPLLTVAAQPVRGLWARPATQLESVVRLNSTSPATELAAESRQVTPR